MVDIKKITQIPSNFSHDAHETFLKYCIRNFDRFHLVSVVNQNVANQYLAAKTNEKGKASFGAISNVFNIFLEQIEEKDEKKIRDFLVKKDNEVAGIVSFQHKLEDKKGSREEEKLKRNIDMDRIIEVTGRSLIGDSRAMLLSSLEKKQISFKWKWLFPMVILGLLAVFSLIFAIKNKLSQELDMFAGGEKGLFFKMAIPVIVLLAMLLVVTFLDSDRKKKKGTERIEEKIDKILKDKLEVKQQEEKNKKDLIKFAFTIVVKGDDFEEVNTSLEQTKRSVETLFLRNGLEIEGKALLQEEGVIPKIKRFFGWDINSFFLSLRNWKLFNPVILPISSAVNYFQLRTSLPSSQREVESFRYEAERVTGEWYMGKQIYNPQMRFDFYLNASDLINQVFIVGPNGRGKSFFVLKMLSRMMKYTPGTHFLIFDLKGGEYVRFLANKHSVLVIMPGTKEAPLALNIFQIDDEDLDSNKRFVKNLLSDYLKYSVSSKAELSPFMEDCVNKAIDKVFELPFEERNLKSFVQAISNTIDRYGKEGVSWAESTRVALKARFGELFTGWFKKVFGVEKSNFNVRILRRYNVIIKLDHLIRDNDLATVKLITNTIMNLISRQSKELSDLNSKNPWLVCVFEEAQKIVPRIRKDDTSELSAIESFMEIARAYGVSSIAVGQNPNRISERFEQSGLIVDFGTESKLLDNVIFAGGEDPSASASKEKERLRKRGMCFVKITGLKRVLLEVDELHPQTVLRKEQIKGIVDQELKYELLRENYLLDEISDFEGKRNGEKWKDNNKRKKN